MAKIDLLTALNGFRNLRVCRRDVLTRFLGTAGAIGALQLLNAKEARANDETDDMGDLGGQIDPALLKALRSDRENSEGPGLVFSSDSGLLVGFGPNLYHADSSSTRLFVKGQQVLKSSIQENVAENIAALATGTSGTIVQTTQDRFGRVVTGTIIVESVHDVPDDFLITGETTSNRYTGSFFSVKVLLGTQQASIATFKTTYNLLTRSFPLGFNVTPGNLFNQSADSIIDVDAVRLQAIAARIIAMELGTLDALIPTDLQQDFPWGKIFRTVVVAVVAGPIAAAGYVLATEPAVRRVGIVLAVFALLAALSGIIGNRADKGLDEILKMMQQPAPPPPPLIP
jgi:hypothetical protein